MSIDKYDRRVIERKIQEGRATRDEYEKFLDSEVMSPEEFKKLSQPSEVQFIRRTGSKAEDDKSED